MPRYFPSVQPLPKTRRKPSRRPSTKIILERIDQVSKNARATWFSLLGLLAFVGVTLLGHKDADFFAFGAETQLPLVGITVPVTAFFFVAPTLVAALYAYFHLYLLNLWNSLADAPAKPGGQPLADRIFPWLISYAALRERDRRRGDDSVGPRALGYLVTTISLLFGWLFGIAMIFGFWLRSMPAHEEWLTLWIGFWLWIAALIGYTSFATAAMRMGGASRDEAARPRRGRRICAAGLAIFLGILSWVTTEGWNFSHAPGTPPPFLYSANLVLAELTRKPSGWLPWHLWMEDFEAKFRRREGIQAGAGLTGEQETAFRKEAAERYTEYISQLDAPDLRRADLRSARMSGAFLPGANLRKAKMQGANFRNAAMQGVNLFRAEMQGATFLRARLQGADLRLVMLQGAQLDEAAMQGAQLDGAAMPGATLVKTTLQNATCGSFELRGRPVEFDLRGALLKFADVTCLKLTQAQLEGAVGNQQTVLPPDLTVASCLETLPEDAEAVLAQHPEKGDRFRLSRAEIRKTLLCDEGKTPRIFSTPAPH